MSLPMAVPGSSSDKTSLHFEKPSVFLYEFLKFECGALVTSRVNPSLTSKSTELVTSLSQRTQTLKIRINKTGGFSKLKIGNSKTSNNARFIIFFFRSPLNYSENEVASTWK